MNELERIWKPHSEKQTPKSEDEDSINTSLAETLSTKSSSYTLERKGGLDASSNELDISLEDVCVPDQGIIKTPTKLTRGLSLASSIPANELMTATTDNLLRAIVNTKKNYIDVQQLAKMLFKSYADQIVLLLIFTRP